MWTWRSLQLLERTCLEVSVILRARRRRWPPWRDRRRGPDPTALLLRRARVPPRCPRRAYPLRLGGLSRDHLLDSPAVLVPWFFDITCIVIQSIFHFPFAASVGCALTYPFSFGAWLKSRRRRMSGACCWVGVFSTIRHTFFLLLLFSLAASGVCCIERWSVGGYTLCFFSFHILGDFWRFLKNWNLVMTKMA